MDDVHGLRVHLFNAMCWFHHTRGGNTPLRESEANVGNRK